jgi:hypothetical protein
MKKMMKRVKAIALNEALKVKGILNDTRGEGYIDTAIKILIAVVLGALLLAGLYALFGDVVMPTLVDKIKSMFNYAG